MDLLRVFGGIYALLEIFARLLHQIFLSSHLPYHIIHLIYYGTMYMFHPHLSSFLFFKVMVNYYYFLDNLQIAYAGRRQRAFM